MTRQQRAHDVRFAALKSPMPAEFIQKTRIALDTPPIPTLPSIPMSSPVPSVGVANARGDSVFMQQGTSVLPDLPSEQLRLLLRGRAA
ncbi:hypothetical protein O988_05296 [Pseudogymnoascus sp. VKM F-3808]|nr:hypothetical protein O988_05296 [Pseudogymnoascus sp. VKM F-3808]